MANNKKSIKKKKSITDNETSYILDNDYRIILANYDASKNKSRPIISIYEKSLLIGKRATQIAYGATPLIPVEPGMTEVEIAETELQLRKMPLIIKRTIGESIEYWRPCDMILH